MSQRLESARLLKQQGSLSAAAKAYEAALTELRSGSDRALLAHTVLEYGQTELAAGVYGTAFSASRESADLFRELNDLAGQALAANLAGSSHLYTGKYGEAIRAYQDALALDLRQHDGKGEITRLSNIGNVYFFEGKYLEALGKYEQALRRVEGTAAEPWNPGAANSSSRTSLPFTSNSDRTRRRWSITGRRWQAQEH